MEAESSYNVTFQQEASETVPGTLFVLLSIYGPEVGHKALHNSKIMDTGLSSAWKKRFSYIWEFSHYHITNSWIIQSDFKFPKEWSELKVNNMPLCLSSPYPHMENRTFLPNYYKLPLFKQKKKHWWTLPEKKKKVNTGFYFWTTTPFYYAF